MRMFRKREEPAPVAPPVVEAPSEPASVAPLRVLVVDDTPDIRVLMRMSLERAGFELVGTAEDGEEAIGAARRALPDLILLDLHMPGLSGMEALPFLIEASPGSRVVMFSAIAPANQMLESALAAGASGYIVKGVSPKLIAEHLRKVAASDEARPVQPWPLQ